MILGLSEIRLIEDQILRVRRDMGDDPFKIHLLIMADGSEVELCELRDRYAECLHLVFSASLLQAKMSDMEADLSRQFAELLCVFDDSERWLTSLSEINFAGQLPLQMLRRSVLQNVVTDLGQVKVYCVGDRVFSSLVQDVCAGLELGVIWVTQKPRRKPLVKLIWRVFLLALWNFFQDFICLCLCRWQPKSRFQSEGWVYASFPRHWILDKEGNEYFKYLGKKSSTTLESVGYVLTLSRQNKASIKSFTEVLQALYKLKSSKLSKRVAIIESYGSFGSLFKNYLFRLLNLGKWLSLRKRWCESFPSNELMSQWIKEDIWLGYFVDVPKNKYFLDAASRCFQELQMQRAIVPFFEFVEGRCIVGALRARGLGAYGLEHSANGPVHQWRTSLPLTLMKDEANGFRYVPGCFLLEGKHSVAAYENCGHVKTTVVGGSRLANCTVSEPVSEGVSSKTVLVLCELHDPLRLLYQVAPICGQLDLRVVARPHPSSVQIVSKALNGDWFGKSLNISLDTVSTLTSSLRRYKPLAVIVGVTGGAVDVAREGYPLVLVGSNWCPNYSVFTSKAIDYPLTIGSESIRSEIIRLSASDEHRNRLIRVAQAGAALAVTCERGEPIYNIAKAVSLR